MHSTRRALIFERPVDVPYETARHRLDGWTSHGSGRRLRLEVEQWSSSGEGALLILRPTRRVRPTPSYFRDGWRLLDEATAIAEGRAA
jgi:hypothetical protein